MAGAEGKRAEAEIEELRRERAEIRARIAKLDDQIAEVRKILAAISVAKAADVTATK
jgi:prefoldin subunit 5